MSRHTSPIDWRFELAKLDSHINGKGGVVRITYNGDVCAPREFREVMKNKYENKSDNQTWISIRIDRGWHSTRYLADILHAFNVKLGFYDEESKSDEENTAPIRILTGNEFHGDADINIDQLHVNSDSTFSLPAERDQRVDDTYGRLRKLLSTSGHIMVILNHAPTEGQGEFWNYFWHERLESLVKEGLFFVQMVDRSDGGGSYHDLAPAPDFELDLPESLDDIRQDDARNDLIEILVNEVNGLSQDAASAAAVSHVNSNYDSVKRLHDTLPWLILGLRESHG